MVEASGWNHVTFCDLFIFSSGLCYSILCVCVCAINYGAVFTISQYKFLLLLTTCNECEIKVVYCQTKLWEKPTYIYILSRLLCSCLEYFTLHLATFSHQPNREKSENYNVVALSASSNCRPRDWYCNLGAKWIFPGKCFAIMVSASLENGRLQQD